MYKCDQCGRILKKKQSLQGHILCSKHMHQLYKYGKFLDNIQRTTKDLNDYIIEKDIVKVHCYNQRNQFINDFIIDIASLNKIKYYKWRLNQNYPITGFGKKQKLLTHILLKVKENQIVDHINGNPLDNRLKNLRICTQSENVLNKKNILFTGIFEDKRRKYKRFCVEIHYKYKKIFLGNYLKLSYAIYARYIAEIILFKEFRRTDNDDKKLLLINNLSTTSKFNIIHFVTTKIIHKL